MRLSETKVDLFSTGSIRAFELGAGDIAALQRFYDANPEYHWIVGGQAPTSDAAWQDFHAVLPPGWPFKRKWLVGFVDSTDLLIGVADVVSDLFAEGIWWRATNAPNASGSHLAMLKFESVTASRWESESTRCG